MQLTQKDITRYESALSMLDAAKDKIDDRVGEIIGLIHKIFKKDFNGCWWYPNAREDGVGEIDSVDPDSFISFELQDHPSFDIYDYSCSFTAIFLTMSDKEISNYIQAEIDQHQKQKEKEKRKREDRKNSKDTLKQQALKKLTKEEKKALGLEGSMY